ncbi:MAG: hypothetical protein JO257_17305 [Deltaproteobacteria bacterium]|nr:hypothetical protein [Deltaproteobacteria bacterium]
MTRARRDVRVLAEITVAVVATWLLLAWFFDRAIEQADASVLNLPYVASALRGGASWTSNVYRFGVVGGSAMQPIGGASPFVQLCALLGVSATTTLNALTCLLQIFVAFFGIKTAEALATTWSGAPRMTTVAERIVAVWLCGFAPAIGWRIAVGDEHLILGLLPFLAITTLAWCARARTLDAVTVLVAAAAVAHGMSGIGAQSVVYGATFGAPIVIASLARRWTRAECLAVAGLLGGVLVVLPRLVSLAAYSVSDDAARAVGDSVAYSYGASSWLDWLGSVPWTRALAHGAATTINEQNIPLGPLLVVIAAARSGRRLAAVVAVSALLAILYATDVWPVRMLSDVPVLGAFRVPARAILPAVVMIAPLALAAFLARRPTAVLATPPTDAATRPIEPAPWRRDALAMAVAVLVIIAGRAVPGVAREVLAWGACGGTLLALRWRPTLAFPALALAASLGVVAFDERFLRDVPHERIEKLAELRDTLVAQEPALRSQLVRVELVTPPLPYDMSTAFAADLASLDGVWYPPRRFLALLSALKGHAIPVTTCVFQLARDPTFRVLQQLYDVQLAVAFTANGLALERLPPTNGPAWFPARVVVGDAAAFAAAMHASTDVRAELAATAWRDGAGAAASQCTGATVGSVTTEGDGQRATIEVSTPAPCTLVVATNYVAMFTATDEARHELPTFPIDVALTGIAVPAHASRIELAARVSTPLWASLLAVLGAAAIAWAAWAAARASSSARAS